MSTDTIEGTLEREDTHTNSELKLADVRAEIERQDEQDGQEAGSLADMLRLYRSWSDDLDQFRAELTAWREEGLLDVHMPDGPEARRRRGLLAPLAAPQPGPYSELAPANLDAEHEAAKQARQQRKAIGWTPNVPQGAGPTSILGEVEPDGWVRSTRLRRALAWIGSRREKWGA